MLACIASSSYCIKIVAQRHKNSRNTWSIDTSSYNTSSLKKTRDMEYINFCTWSIKIPTTSITELIKHTKLGLKYLQLTTSITYEALKLTLIILAAREGAPLKSAIARCGRRGLRPPTRRLLLCLLWPHHASYSPLLGPMPLLGGPHPCLALCRRLAKSNSS
jgi:hypothetical protein